MIESADSLTRFLFSSRHFKVKPTESFISERAFRPDDDEPEPSVFRTTGKSGQEIWEVGVRYVLPERQAANSKAKIHARADFNAAAPISLGLRVEPDPPPPPEHFLLKGWPSGKDERMQIAQELAARAFLFVPSGGPLA